jgi:hypothetical protein
VTEYAENSAIAEQDAGQQATSTADVGQTPAGQSGEQRKRKKRWIVLIIVIAALLLAVLLHEAGLYRFPWEHTPAPIVAGDLFPGQGDADDGHLPNMTPEEIMAQMQKVADAAYFSFKINSRPEFENGRAAGTLGIENPNNNLYPMVVQIFLDDTGELIYDSGGLLPDQHIYQAKLLRALPKGEHKATAYLNAYDPDTKEWQGKQAAALNIIVKN